MALIWSVYTIGMLIFYKESKIHNECNEEGEGLVSGSRIDYGSTSNNCEENCNTKVENIQSWSSIFNG